MPLASERAIARVDVSVNGGRDWEQAVLEQRADAPTRRGAGPAGAGRANWAKASTNWSSPRSTRADGATVQPRRQLELRRKTGDALAPAARLRSPTGSVPALGGDWSSSASAAFVRYRSLWLRLGNGRTAKSNGSVQRPCHQRWLDDQRRQRTDAGSAFDWGTDVSFDGCMFTNGRLAEPEPMSEAGERLRRPDCLTLGLNAMF